MACCSFKETEPENSYVLIKNNLESFWYIFHCPSDFLLFSVLLFWSWIGKYLLSCLSLTSNRKLSMKLMQWRYKSSFFLFFWDLYFQFLDFSLFPILSSNCKNIKWKTYGSLFINLSSLNYNSLQNVLCYNFDLGWYVYAFYCLLELVLVMMLCA